MSAQPMRVSDEIEARTAVADVDIVAASLHGQREDFVIDLRVDGRVETYLRDHPDTEPAGSRSLRVTRRALDICTAAIGLSLTSPVFVGLYLLGKIRKTGPVFFSQERVGQGGRIFKCVKFRTMHPDADERLRDLLASDEAFRREWEVDHKVKRDPRVTNMGRILRKTSLDELPQLINVLKGDMSIVGPRPIVPEETVRYGEAMPRVLTVRPGITGLWQVSGRNDLPYPERVALDLRYVDEQSVLLDASIIAKTLVCVATGDGASSVPCAFFFTTTPVTSSPSSWQRSFLSAATMSLTRTAPRT